MVKIRIIILLTVFFVSKPNLEAKDSWNTIIKYIDLIHVVDSPEDINTIGHVSDCRLSFVIPKVIEKFINVRTINFYNANIMFNEEFFKLPNLKYLELDSTVIINPDLFRDNLDNLKNLVDFNLSNVDFASKTITNNHINSLGIYKSIFSNDTLTVNSKNLRRLSLNNPNITSLILNADSLKSLNIVDNKKVNLYPILSKFKNTLNTLRFNELENDQIIDILNIVVNYKIPIAYIEMFKNDIDQVPKNLFKIKSLERLHLISNHINEIPIEILNLVNLKYLTVGEELKSPPIILKELKSLELVWLPQSMKSKMNEEDYHFKIKYFSE
jgi:Leucine-rich repeat (LRR) protein